MKRARAGVILEHLRKLGSPADDVPSDRELLHRFARGRDEAAFTILARRHGPMVLSVGRRTLHDAQAAEDVCQAVFLVLASQAGSRKWQESVASWLYRVAHHVARRANRAAGRRRLHESRTVPRPSTDPAAEVTARELQTALDDELARLPEKYRAPLVLCYLGGMAFSADGMLLVTADGTRLGDKGGEVICGITVWEAPTGRRLHRAVFPGLRPDCLALSPDWKTAAVGGASSVPGGLIRIWDLPRGKEIRALPVQGHVITSLAFSPDGRRLVSAGSDGAVRLWEVATGKEILARKDHRAGVAGVAFSPSGRTVASAAGTDLPWVSPAIADRICLWDVATGEQVQRFHVSDSSPPCLAFAPDGSRLASGMQNGSVLLWELPAAPRPNPLRRSPLGVKELEALWAGDLAGADAARAHRAIGLLSGSAGQAVPFIKQRLRPGSPPERKRIRQLIADLDSPDSAACEKAATELDALRAWTEPFLRRALGADPSPQVRRRVDHLLNKLQVPTSEEHRTIRLIEVLERIGNSEAVQLLRALAQTGNEVHSLQEVQAAAALERLTRLRTQPD